MKSFGILLSLAFASFALSNPTGYKEVSDLVWEGQVTPGGKVYTFNGTFEEIYQEVLALNPNYYSDDFGVEETHSASDHSIEKRDNIICDLAGDRATLKDIRTVIKRLKGSGNSKCTAASGPGVCTRLNCAYGSYVTFCNDNKTPITRNCAEFGNMAQTIVDSCTPRNSPVLIGQYFNSDFHFNALLKGGGPC